MGRAAPAAAQPRRALSLISANPFDLRAHKRQLFLQPLVPAIEVRVWLVAWLAGRLG